MIHALAVGALLSSAAAPTAPGEQAFLVKDINETGGSDRDSDPHEWLTVGATTFFAATHVQFGTELWKTTASGPPELVLDIEPLDSSDPELLTEVGGTLYFTAFTAAHGRELWTSDGTAAGTQLVRDIAPGDADASPTGLVDLGGSLVFSAWAPGLGRELWISDGTAAGTQPIADIHPGNPWSNPQALTVLGDRVFFRATDGIDGQELWSSDGTALGTERVADLFPGPDSGFPTQLSAIGNRLYFAATSGAGVEPWTSDGTGAGTALFADLIPGPVGSNPVEFVESAGTTYFIADAGAERRVWTSDGTPGGTAPLDVTPSGTTPNFLTPLGNGVLFRLVDGFSDRSAWFTDGTAGGTVELLEYVDLVVEDQFSKVAVLGNLAVFGGLTGFWATDGTPAGTQEIATTGPDTTYSDGSVVWLGIGEVWTTDGSSAGTQFFADVNPGPLSDNSSPGFLTALRDRLYFTADDGVQPDRQLWVSDGSEAGTVPAFAPVPWIEPRSVTATDRYLWVEALGAAGIESWLAEYGRDELVAAGVGTSPVEYGEQLYFGRDLQLWRSNGTAAGTQLFFESPEAESSPRPRVEFQGRLFFEWDVTSSGRELWSTDGTVAGTELFADFNPGAGWGNIGEVAVGGGQLFVRAFQVGVGTSLWATDGSAEDGVFVTDFYPENLRGTSHGVFFTTSTEELWWSDGTAAGTFPVPGAPQDAEELVVADDTLFFFGSCCGDDVGLWKCSSPPGVAELVDNTVETPNFGNPEIAVATSDERVLFPNIDAVYGYELWMSDGTEAGTELLASASPIGNSFAAEPTRAGEFLFFTAGTDVGASASTYGWELYAVRTLATQGYVAQPYGTGCAGSSGAAPVAGSSTPAVSGSTFAVELSEARPNSVALLLSSFAPGALPLGACTLQLGFPFDVTATVATDGQGAGSFAFPIPDPWGLAGVPLYLQFAVADPGGSFEGVAALSNGLEVLAGL